jgi:hypothetical protein
MPFTSMVYLVQNLTFADPAIQLVLLQHISQTGRLKREDWILLAKSITYDTGSPITADTVVSWLANKCKLSVTELKTWLNYVTFIDGSVPTYVLTQTGDFVLTESAT